MTRYRWSSLRSDHRLLSRNPPGCMADHSVPVVFAALRPAATLSQPSRLHIEITRYRWSSLRSDQRLLSRNPPGCMARSLGTGGLRCAPTTGYSLATLQVARQDPSVPVVFAALRPPATLSQPSRLHGRSLGTGGLRCAPTTGYSLATLQVAWQILSSPLTEVSQRYDYPHFRWRKSFNGLRSFQLRSVPCSSSAFNSAAVCICRSGSSTVREPFGARLIARLTASNPCLKS